jgi:hypothetical protein
MISIPTITPESVADIASAVSRLQGSPVHSAPEPEVRAPSAATVLPSDFIVATEAVVAEAASSSTDPPRDPSAVTSLARRMPVVHAEPEAEIAAEDQVPVEVTAANATNVHLEGMMGAWTPPGGGLARGANFYRSQFFRMEELFVGSVTGVVHFTMFPVACTGTEQVYRRDVCKTCVRVFKEQLRTDEFGRVWPPIFYRTASTSAKIHFFDNLGCTSSANRDSHGYRIITQIPGCRQCVIAFTARINRLFDASAEAQVSSDESTPENSQYDENDSEA